MSLDGIEACGDTKYQNFECFLIKEKFFLNLPNLMSKFIFSKLKVRFANPFPKRLFSVLSSYLHHLGGCIRQIKRHI